jgi:N,N'-diacetyllegionaminate synthase
MANGFAILKLNKNIDSVFIIAEAGVNHNGDIEIAKKMIDVAATFDVDAIKFQTFHADKVVIRTAEKSKYQMETTGVSESQFAMLKKLELSENQHRELIEHCQKKGITFLSTAFDPGSIELLESFNVPVHKIPSGEITNLPYLIKIAQTGKPVILSTGMSTLEEVRAAIEILKYNGSGEITVLHCNTEYPTPYTDVNLKVMLTMQRKLGVKVGYSDHTPGIEVPIAAVAMGASVIEKHFTLDKNMEGPDHKASLEPDEFAAMVRAIRNIEKALGTDEKKPSSSEIKNMDIVRKSIVAARDITKGEIFTEDNITVKRPGNGISPMKWLEVLGTTSVKDFVEDELIVL